ncbi:fap1 adhesin isoform X2 [Harmonia axyridis]|uniref:fap1 adhesin isoform X2 n=1 Tax=Harmonia axyridis TaxID=115357 RepID=UPI001E2788BC|nr:fap1 adhesin isoform X2 [Harmonia axyridis]
MEIGQENLESCSLKGEIVISESIDDTLVTDAEVAEAVNTISESLDDTLVSDTEVVKTISKSPDVTLVTDVEEAETVETISESMGDTLVTDAEIVETISESLVTDAEAVETISESLVTDAETVETKSESLVIYAETVETISESLITDAETVETISESLITDAETVETISEMADDTLVTDEKVAETISESIDDTHVTDAEVAETVETISESIEDTLVTDAEVAETVETISESIDDTLVTDAEVDEAVVTISEPMNNTLVTHAKVAETVKTISESIDDTLVTDTEVVETVKEISESLDDTIVTEMEVVETVTEKKLDSSSEDIIKAAESSNDDNHSEENLIEKQESEEITEKEPVEEIAEQIQPSSSETQVEVVQENTSETISSICEPSEEQEQDNIDTQPIQMGDHKVEQRLENVDQVSIECVSERGDAEMVEEDKKIELTEPMKKSDEEPCSISTPEAEKSTTEDTAASELPEVSEVDDLRTNIVDNEEPDSIPTQNIEEFMDVTTEPSESAVDQTTDNSELKSAEDNLVPVEEEPCVKKVIIYEHDCRIDQTEDKSENDAAILSTHITETQEKEPEDPLVQEAGEFCSTLSHDLDRKKVESEEPTISQDEDPAVIEEVFEQQEQIVHEDNIQSNQTEEVSSSDQQEIPELAEKTHENVDHNAEPTMEDQTSAAVQSILDNMLTEERSRERVIEKEEPQVVHSSYSSYEVQKAVQEIQGISLPENIVEMSAEEIECISSSEKLCESEKAVLEEENIVVPNMEDQKEVEPEIGESEALKETTISKPDSIQTIETTEYVGPEEMFKDKVESIDESPNSPLSNTENQESVTHSDVLDGEDADARIIEQVPSAAKYSSETRDQQDPVVIPSIDLSEESSSEDASDEDNRHVVSSSVQSNFFTKESHADIKAASSKTPSKADKVSSNSQFKNESKKFSPRETRHSSRISEKLKPHSLKDDIDQPLSVNIDDIEREKPYSPKITIKPIKEDEPNEDKEEHKGSLKITITKQSDNTHSILKMCSPDVDHRQKQTESEESNVVPKLVIKTSDTHSEQNSPKISTRSSKQVIPANSNIRSGSPRITIKPIVKPEVRETIASPLKITIKPIGKPEEFSRQQQRHSPKQSKNKSDDDHYSTRSKVPKTSENSDVHSPKVTIKPVKHPEESEVVSTPKITIKPIEKPEEARVSPKITIKPVVRPIEVEAEVEDEVKERIVLKINKGNLPAKDTERIGRESRKRELEDDKSEKLAKIKLKFSKDGDAHIVHKGTDAPTHKRQHDFENERSKRFKADVTTDSDDDVKLIENTQSPIVISEDSQSQDSVILIEDAKDPLALAPTPEPITPVVPVSAPRKRGRPRKVPLVAREDFGSDMKDRMTQPITPVSVSSVEQPAEGESTGRPKRSCRAQSVRDTLGIKPRKPSKPRGGKRGAKANSSKAEKDHGLLSVTKIEVTPRSSLTEEALQDARSSKTLKVEEVNKEEQIKPFGLKRLLEAAIDQNIIEVIEIDSPSNSPKCLDKIEEEDGVVEVKPLEYIDNPDKDISFSGNIGEIKEFEIQKVESLNDGCNKDPSEFGGADAAASDVEMQPPTPVFAPPLSEVTTVDINSTSDIAMFEEETRMSADANSRAQTPAKQVVSADVVVEESQSSVQSTATTESGKISRRSRLEVHQDQDGSVFTADQLNEYYWGGNGPFMIQEQVAQFLGIKSFKRKYPGIPRRMVDMQERDYIRENGLASESMCDLGLTAVNSADILDIMYTDFQEKYEEFCRFQRDKQAKDLLNKQKALSLATNQEKSKLDILEQAVQSAAAYNANFNKTRREQRRACMDLQTMNIHYPKGRLKKISMPKIGNYPVAVVPGQFTDYYKEFTPTELNNLPLNTMLYTELHKILPEASDSDSDSSGSDSDDSSSSGSESNSSCEDNCKMCEKGSLTPRKSPVHSSI